MSVLLGLIWSAIGLNVPKFLDNWVDFIGNAASGTALFLIGLSVYFVISTKFLMFVSHGKTMVGPNWAEITITIVLKQVCLPVLTVVLLSTNKLQFSLFSYFFQRYLAMRTILPLWLTFS